MTVAVPSATYTGAEWAAWFWANASDYAVATLRSELPALLSTGLPLDRHVASPGNHEIASSNARRIGTGVAGAGHRKTVLLAIVGVLPSEVREVPVTRRQLDGATFWGTGGRATAPIWTPFVGDLQTIVSIPANRLAVVKMSSTSAPPPITVTEIVDYTVQEPGGPVRTVPGSQIRTTEDLGDYF